MQNDAAVKSKVKTKKLLCLPAAGGNPYQNLFYQKLPKNVVTEFRGPGGLEELQNETYNILHLHWDDRMFGRSEDDAQNRRDLMDAITQMMEFKAQGGRIVWTIHNKEPHKARDLETFREGRHALAKLADAIHVHAPHAADHMEQEYAVPRNKLHVVPHPSYLGAYEPKTKTLKRALAKSNTREFLFFGMFRGEKGVHSIRDVAGKLTKRDVPYHLRMYGKAFTSQRRLLRLLAANPSIDLRTDRIPDEEIPEIFGSAHVFLAPYNSLFTSGSVMLALTFGLPVIGPDIRELRETTPPECHGFLYDPDAPRGLIRGMLQAIEMSDSDLRAARRACFDFAKDRAPDAMSTKLADLLLQ